MKRLFSVALLSLSIGLISQLFAQNQKSEPAKKDGPEITFKEDLHDFGKIQEGVVAEYTFTFTNSGNQPLVIEDVRPSCGCTSPSWSKEPVAPGQTGMIRVAYNSNGRPGSFYKSVSITSNVPNETKVLYIKGEVIPNPNKNVNPNQSPVLINPKQ